MVADKRVPRLFIGSSSESLAVARGLKANLEDVAEVRVWDEGLFIPGNYILEDLLKFAESFDFAIFVWTADDSVISRGSQLTEPRDNVILEAGLFYGILGRERVFLCAPRSLNVKSPSDLLGLKVLSFQEPSDANYRAATGSAASEVAARIATLGTLHQHPGDRAMTKVHSYLDFDAARTEDVAGRLPEVAVMSPLEAGPTTAQAAEARYRGPNVLTLFAECHKVLRDSVVEFDDPELGRLTGWSHFLHESFSGERPTAIGTAYGLKLVLSIDENSGVLDRSALAETLWKLRKKDGGWAARTQSAVGRPEVTALALGALSSVGYYPERVAEAGAVFEESLSAGNDPVTKASTYVVSTVVRGLVSARPASPLLPELRASLLAGSIQDADRGNLLCWADRFLPTRDQVLAPSVAHTAHAVVALSRAGQVLGEDAPSRSALDQAIRWLVSRSALDNQVEHIRRVITEEHWEVLTVRHFTAAWVARAILAASAINLPGVGPVLEEAVRRVLLGQRNGIWEWDDHDRPIWMTYQGVRVLRDYALRTRVAL